MDVVEFKKQPVIGILRGIQLEQVEPLIESVVKSGLKTLEITMNTPGAGELIRKAVKVAQKRVVLGAGTVLDMDSLKQALNSGATFIVMPVLVESITAYCVKNNIPVFPGAFSPLEIYRSWCAGATMVKVFPAKSLGPEYFRQIKGPFNQVKLLACAGVTAENTREYLSSGADAIAFGASVFKKEWIKNNDYASITSAIKGYLDCL